MTESRVRLTCHGAKIEGKWTPIFYTIVETWLVKPAIAEAWAPYLEAWGQDLRVLYDIERRVRLGIYPPEYGSPLREWAPAYWADLSGFRPRRA